MVEMVALVTVVKPYMGWRRVTVITRIAVIVRFRSINVPPTLITLMDGRTVTVAVMHPVERARLPGGPNRNCVIDRHRACGLTGGNASHNSCDQT